MNPSKKKRERRSLGDRRLWLIQQPSNCFYTSMRSMIVLTGEVSCRAGSSAA